jgi:hypothetical protein
MHWMPQPIPQPRHAFALGDRTRPSQRVGLALAIMLHLALFALLLRPIHREIKALLELGTTAALSGGGGGGGGERMAYISLPAPSASTPVPAPQTPVIPPPVVATPTPPLIIPPVTPVVAPEAAVAGSIVGGADSAIGAGPGTGGGAGGGIGPGTGLGSGPGTGGGEGGLARGPRRRSEMWPSVAEPPKNLRGQQIRIVMSVRADGRVGAVRFEPDMSGKFADRLRETMQSYRFSPALSATGTPIDGTYVYYLTF